MEGDAGEVQPRRWNPEVEALGEVRTVGALDRRRPLHLDGAVLLLKDDAHVGVVTLLAELQKGGQST